MPAQKISIDKAKPEKLFYFVANVVAFRESDGRCLILKRHEREVAHPGKYGVIGGKLEWEDLPVDKPYKVNGDVLDYDSAVEKLLQREAEEEAGIEIGSELKYINSVAFIRPHEVPVVMVKFAARYKSGEVRLDPSSHTEFAWVNAEEVKNYDCIMGVDQEVQETIKLFS